MSRGGQARATAALLAAALLACDAGPAEPGLHFRSLLIDVGRMYAGPSVPLVYPFTNGPVAVALDSMTPDCGCLEPQLWVAGELLPLPVSIPPGARGEVRTEYRTEGFSGRKKSGVSLRGPGPGLPIQLRVDSILDTWLAIEPEIADFGVVDGLAERSLRARVRGPEPFRLSALLAGAPGLEVRGAPTPEAALEHQIEVVLAPSLEDGPHAAFLNLGSDRGWSVRLPVKWEIAGPLYIIPHRLLPLGRIPPGVAASAAIEVGVREGSLEPPEVRVEDLAGVDARVRTIQESSRYRVDLSFPDDLPAGAFSARVRILLRHRRAERVDEVEREIRVLGVVQA